jgi:hypothetical protein
VPVISENAVAASATQIAGTGKVIPVADAAGVTVDTTTYANAIRGSGHYTTLVFTAETALLAVAQSGDAFPRWVFGSEPDGDGIYMGDGTVDPTSASVISVVPRPNFGHFVPAVNALYLSGIISSGLGVPVGGGYVGDLFIRRDSGTQIVYLCTVAGTAGNATWVPVLTPGSPVGLVTSGALSTVQLVTATGAQILTTRDAETITPCTFNPGVATTATVTVALSSDNVTYSTLGIETVPVGVALDGTIHLVKVRVPAGWYIKLTVNAQAVLGLTTYY